MKLINGILFLNKKLIPANALILFLLLITSTSNAQSWQWANGAGGNQNDFAGGVDVDNSGNSFVAGRFKDSINLGTVSLANYGTTSIYVAVYDPNGMLLWAKILAEDSLLSISGICVDHLGTISITGQFLGTAVFGLSNPVTLTSTGDYDVYTASYNSSGNLLWAKSAGGPGNDFTGGISTDNQGNIFITGDFHMSSYPASASKVFISKYDINGNCQWTSMPYAYGNFHYGMGIKTDKNGNSYIAGQFFGSLIFDSTMILNAGNIEANAFVAKFNDEGNLVWINKAGAASGYTGANAIDIDGNGNAFITGYYRGIISFDAMVLHGPSGISYDVFVAKCDSNGNFMWVNNGAGNGTLDEARGISVDANGDCYFSGYFTDTITFGSYSGYNKGYRDLFISKINSNGGYEWVTQCGGLMNLNFGSIKATTNGIYIVGNFTDSIGFGTTHSLVSGNPGTYEIFVAKISDNITGVEGKSFPDDILLYPNPASNKIQLKGLVEETGFVLRDCLGKIMERGVVTDRKQISIADFETGIYFIELTGNYKSSKSRILKFVKQE